VILETVHGKHRNDQRDCFLALWVRVRKNVTAVTLTSILSQRERVEKISNECR
jgi:hypothetical protein